MAVNKVYRTTKLGLDWVFESRATSSRSILIKRIIQAIRDSPEERLTETAIKRRVPNDFEAKGGGVVIALSIARQRRLIAVV